MRWLYLVTALSGVALPCSHVGAQTFAIGTTTPNPNAALHVEAPTGNQGFIMPRLTTSQRTAAGFTSLLGTADNGLMVYDRDLNVLFIWDGATWKSSQEVAQANLATQAQGLVLPYADTVSSAPTNSNLLRLIYNGTGANVGVAQFENLDPTNGFTTLFVRNQGLNSAGYFQQLNNATTGVALRGITNSNQAGGHGVLGLTTGTGGSAGVFQVTSATNAQPAVNITHSGTGNAITANRPIQATQFIGDGSLLTGISGGMTFPFSNSTSSSSTLFDITNSGTGQAGAFAVDNAASSAAAVRGTTNGTGQSLLGIHNGPSGSVGLFFSNTTTNNSPGLEAFIEGTNNVLKLTSNNAANSSPALSITHNGTGNAITANRPIQATQFIGDGSLLTGISGFSLPYSNSLSAGSSAFSISNTSGTHGAASFFSSSASTATLETQSSGGTAFMAFNSGSLGTGGEFIINNASNSASSVYAINAGIGKAGQFSIANAANSNSSLYTETNGTGSGLSVFLSEASNSSPAINISHSGTGNAITANRPIQATDVIATGSLHANGLNYSWPGTHSSGVLTNNGSGALTWTPAGGFTLPYSNSISNGSALFSLTNSGSGSTIIANNSGTGIAGIFQNLNAANSNAALTVQSQGAGGVAFTSTASGTTGGAGVFFITDPNNGFVGLQSSTAGGGIAGSFVSSNSTSTNSALQAVHQGLGAGLNVNLTNSSNTNSAIQINQAGTGNAISSNAPIQSTKFIGSAFNTGVAVEVTQNGIGGGGLFTTTNSSSSSPALYATSSGQAASVLGVSTGTASQNYAGEFIIANTSSSATALRAESDANGGMVFSATHSGVGFGQQLQMTNPSNGAAGMYISHEGTGTGLFVLQNNATAAATGISAASVGTGPALYLQQTNNGYGLEFASGGMRYNVTNVGTPGAISIRNTVYNVTTGGTFTFSWTPASGDAVYVYNSNGASITFAGATINATTLARLIYIGGAWRVNQ